MAGGRVGVCVGLGVMVGVAVAVRVADAVGVAVRLGVADAIGVADAVGVTDGLGVTVLLGGGVGEGVTDDPAAGAPDGGNKAESPPFALGSSGVPADAPATTTAVPTAGGPARLFL